MELRISAKNLGALAMPDACPRCTWIKLRAGNNLPFQIFPGIFSSIDSYTKKVIHGMFDSKGQFPTYLEGLGTLQGYVNPPHYSKFQRLDEGSGVTIWGTPDAIFKTPEGGFIIGDYKTAKFTKNADALAPMYDVQLNSYEYIGEVNDVFPVTGLALLYFEPETEPEHAILPESDMSHGFRMGFKCTIKEVERTPGRVVELLEEVRRYAEMQSPPQGKSDCKDCKSLDALITLIQS